MFNIIKDKAAQAICFLVIGFATTILDRPIQADELLTGLDIVRMLITTITALVSAVVGVVRARDYLQSRKTKKDTKSNEDFTSTDQGAEHQA